MQSVVVASCCSFSQSFLSGVTLPCCHPVGGGGGGGGGEAAHEQQRRCDELSVT